MSAEKEKEGIPPCFQTTSVAGDRGVLVDNTLETSIWGKVFEGYCLSGFYTFETSSVSLY